MQMTEWFMQATELTHCNCDWGCPCQFNALPTHGNCRAHVFFQVEKGRFGEVPLDGLRWGALAAWPGPIHEGGGRLQLVVDHSASPEQRAAIESISRGEHTAPGKLILQVFSAVIDEYLPTLMLPIELSFDVERREATVRVPGLLDAHVEPIRNPVTGAEHRARINIPDGFEFRTAEIASGTARSSGPIPIDFEATHAHMARIHWSTHGVIA